MTEQMIHEAKDTRKAREGFFGLAVVGVGLLIGSFTENFGCMPRVALGSPSHQTEKTVTVKPVQKIQPH